MDRVLCGHDVEFKDRNAPARSGLLAEEVVVHITGSKTDQFNVGAVRNHFRSGRALCPVWALGLAQHHFPERFSGGAEAAQPLFRHTDGSFIRREEIQGWLELAALANGQAAVRMGSHSLRIGGATALYHCTQDLSTVQRYGRWASSAFHGYLWESHDRQRDMAAHMASDMSELTAPRGAAGTVGADI